MDARLSPIVASLLLCLAGAAAAPPAPAASSGAGILTLTFENDTFAGRDRYYTSGQRVSWQSRSGAPGPLASAAARLAPWLVPADARVDWGVAVGQWMYTPRDRSARNPARDERPYAGQLAASLSLQAAREDALGLV
ncbi:MAG TPA: lipid A-modifier LpxR family protein, partial [Myxococcota bacterium]